MHREAKTFLSTTLNPYRDQEIHVLEFGSRDVNGSPRELLPAATYYGVDIADGPGVDLICDAAEFVNGTSYDIVLCTEVFEHTPRWPEIIAAARRSLKHLGLAVFTAACDPREPHSAVDGELLQEDTTEYYANIDPHRLKAIMSYQDFDPVLVTTHARGDVYATGIAA